MQMDLWVGELLGVQEPGCSKKRPRSAIVFCRKRRRCDRGTYSLEGTQNTIIPKGGDNHDVNLSWDLRSSTHTTLHIHSVKKVPEIDHSRIPLQKIVKNLFDTKLAPLSSILTWSSSAICHLVCSQCSMLSVYLKCVSRFFQWRRNIEQRICLKFCIVNGISCAESLKILQKAYGESTLSKTRTYDWYSAFKSGRDVVEDLPGSDRPSTSSTQVNIAKVKEMVTENRHWSLREIAAELPVSQESIRTILNDF